jgi:uncharacterized integral membrane protein (TIGR00697 family)
MSLCSIIANIQVLIAVSYEFVDLPTFLGTIVFCSSFLACDMINEHYGEKKAKSAVYLSFFLQLFFMVAMIITLGHTPLDSSDYPDFSISQDVLQKNINAISQIFIPFPRIFFASCIAYLASQLTEICLLNVIKELHCKITYCLRQNTVLFVSNVIVDTIVFTCISFVLLSQKSLSLQDFVSICKTTIIVRIMCNFVNTLFMKLDMYVDNRSARKISANKRI